MKSTAGKKYHLYLDEIQNLFLMYVVQNVGRARTDQSFPGYMSHKRLGNSDIYLRTI